MSRAKGAKRTKSGRVFVTCTLSPDGYEKLHQLMIARGATSQGAVIEESIHRWFAEDPLVKSFINNNAQNINPILRELHNRTCQPKTSSGKLSENG